MDNNITILLNRNKLSFKKQQFNIKQLKKYLLFNDNYDINDIEIKLTTSAQTYFLNSNSLHENIMRYYNPEPIYPTLRWRFNHE